MVLILSTSQSIKYLFSCRLSISSIILLNSWTSFMLPTDLAVTCQLFCTAASIIAWRMENPVGEETMQPLKSRTKIKTVLNVWQRVHKNLHHLKGHRLAESLQVLHYLRNNRAGTSFFFQLCHWQSHWLQQNVLVVYYCKAYQNLSNIPYYDPLRDVYGHAGVCASRE